MNLAQSGGGGGVAQPESDTTNVSEMIDVAIFDANLIDLVLTAQHNLPR
jgi:hypothetical protein